MKVQALFDYWNDKPDHPRWWKSKHGYLEPDVKGKVEDLLKIGYPLGYLCETIDNYYEAMTTKGCWWCEKSTKWNFETLLTKGTRKETMNYKKFTPENWDLDLWWTPECKKQMLDAKRNAEKIENQRQKDREQYSTLIDEYLAKEGEEWTLKKAEKNGLTWLVNEILETK